MGRYVLLPGDPFRTDLIARYFDEPQLVAHNREHKTWIGKLDGVPVAVTSTGMGGPSAAIAVEELIRCGADTFIRVGTAGPVRCPEDCDRYDGVIVTGSVRDEGTTVQYVPIEYPAIANRHVVEALGQAAARKACTMQRAFRSRRIRFMGNWIRPAHPSRHGCCSAGKPGRRAV